MKRPAVHGVLIAGAFCAAMGCSSFHATDSWRARLGSAANGLVIELAADADGTTSAHIHGDSLKGATLEALAHRDGDGWTLVVSELRWFNNWPNGWTEALFPATGELRLRPGGQDWTLAVVTPPRLGTPTAASVRYYEEYATGDRALTAFTRRWDRIRATVAYLQGKLSGQRFDTATGFQQWAGRLLFPELYGYDTPPLPGHRTVRAESIYWNQDYTEANFPEDLRQVRDSGTMLRDFEECPELWQLAFSWDELWNNRVTAARFLPDVRGANR